MLRTWVSETVEVHLEPHIPPSPGLIDLSNVVNTAVLAVPLDMTLPDALSLFSKLDVEVCPVHYQGRLHGMLTRSQLGEFVGKVKNQ